MKSDRRRFLRTSALGAVGLGSLGAAGSYRTDTPDTSARRSPVRLGVASYSLRNLSRSEAIAAIRAIGTPFVNVKAFHLPYEASPAEIGRALTEFSSAGLEIVGGGLISFTEDSDEAVRASFDYARACGMKIIVAGPKPEVLPRIERFAVEYDIRVAIHNHGPEDAYFPAPSDVLRLVRGMDTRMGVCVDVGHTTRTGRDVVAEIAAAGERLHDVHMKDLADLADKDSQCVVGEGRMPIPAIFRQLQAMEYPGFVNLEYEIDADNPLPGMQRSFAYMRGVIAGMQLADG